MAQIVTDMLGATNDPDIRNAVWEAAGGVCLACREPLLPGAGAPRSFHVDHVIPRHHGGQDRLSNYQALCLRCNLSKGATYADYRGTPAPTLLDDEWTDLIGFRVEYGRRVDKEGHTGVCVRWSKDFPGLMLVKKEGGDNAWLTLGQDWMRKAPPELGHFHPFTEEERRGAWEHRPLCP